GAGEQKRPCGAPLRLRAGLGLLRGDRARATHECNQSNATERNPPHRRAPDPSPPLTFLHLHQLSINSLPSTFKVMCTAFHIRDLDSCPLLPNHHSCKAEGSFIRCFRQRKSLCRSVALVINAIPNVVIARCGEYYRDSSLGSLIFAESEPTFAAGTISSAAPTNVRCAHKCGRYQMQSLGGFPDGECNLIRDHGTGNSDARSSPVARVTHCSSRRVW